MDTLFSFLQHHKKNIALATAISTGSYLAAKLTAKLLRRVAMGPVAHAQLEPRRLAGKVVLLTGATSGLGEATAEALIRLDVAHLIIACRSVEKGEALKKRLAASADVAQKITVLRLDLTDLQSVKSFADNYKKLQLPALDLVIENAGLVLPAEKVQQLLSGNSSTHARYEETFLTNVLGHVLLTELLLPELAKSKKDPAVVTLSSAAAYEIERLIETGTKNISQATNIVREMHVKDMALVDNCRKVVTEPGSPFTKLHPFVLAMVLYGWSKRSNVWATIARHNRYNANSGIRFNALHPGFVDTPILFTGQAPWHVTFMLWAASKIVGLSVGEGIQCTLHVANLRNTSGHFFEGCSIADSKLNEDCKNLDRAQELYDFCLDELKAGGYL